jgi:hypothetical protein
MDLTTLKKRIVGYAGRSLTALTSDGVDNVLAAVNDARRQAQRSYNFHLLRGKAFIKTSAAGASLLTCKATPADAGAALPMKLVDRCYNYAVDGGVYKPTSRISFDYDGEFARSVTLAMSGSSSQEAPKNTFAYVQGDDLFVYPNTTESWYMVHGIKWVGDLTDGALETSDIFLYYFSDWLLLAAIQQLNFSIKEDQRVAISDAALRRLWDTVTFMDGQKSIQGEFTNLE